MHAGNIVATLIFILFTWCVIYREYRWKRRLNTWMICEGEVISHHYHNNSDTQTPLVEFYIDGDRRECCTDYILYNDKIGTRLPVLFDPDSDEAVLYTSRHRWFLTWFLSVIAILMLLLVFASYE